MLAQATGHQAPPGLHDRYGFFFPPIACIFNRR